MVLGVPLLAWWRSAKSRSSRLSSGCVPTATSHGSRRLSSCGQSIKTLQYMMSLVKCKRFRSAVGNLNLLEYVLFVDGSLEASCLAGTFIWKPRKRRPTNSATAMSPSTSRSVRTGPSISERSPTSGATTWPRAR
ncbi:hypothetical protein BN381_130158 [Candidatus Microthrix parvicella RN1]|uniref:Uncharacterized protein n=1 Tax=Candidatus Neomicrothrix parvicella RN1 TaxID=1229780 RepID=R4YWZ8_9ACTN|nr:hypothetical protein BN381_130158 [Candidatus Microthrix parvicella RN1]